MGKELLNKAKLQWLAYRLAIMWFALFSLNALCTAITASIVGKNWGELSSQDKFIIVVLITQNWTGTIMAFFSKATQKLSSGEAPTGFFRRDNPDEPNG